MNDSERDDLLSRIDERTESIMETASRLANTVGALPCMNHLERIHAIEMDIRGLKNSSAKRGGLAAALGFVGAALAWLLDHLVFGG